MWGVQRGKASFGFPCGELKGVGAGPGLPLNPGIEKTKKVEGSGVAGDDSLCCSLGAEGKSCSLCSGLRFPGDNRHHRRYRRLVPVIYGIFSLYITGT